MSRQAAIGIGFTVLGVLALLGLGLAVMRQQDQLAALRTQNEALQAEVKEMENLRAEVQAAQHLRNQAAEIQQLRENNQELLRLRNEVRELREQRQELESLRAANAQLLGAVQGTANLPTNQMALVTAARRKGSLLGVSVSQVNDPRLGGRTGVMVTGMAPNATATDSGLKAGDLIRALDGHAIETTGQLQTEMLTRKPGETVLVDILRGNDPLRLQVATQPWPEGR